MQKREDEASIRSRSSTVGFDDIIGHKNVKKRLKAIVRIFTNPEIVAEFKISPPKGMLIYGPPSVSKGMLARAFAKEAKVPCFELGKRKPRHVLPRTL